MKKLSHALSRGGLRQSNFALALTNCHLSKKVGDK